MQPETSLARVVARLQSLPSLSLPTDYPRPSGTKKLVEAAQLIPLTESTCVSLLKLALYEDDDSLDDQNEETATKRPSAFHLLLAAFVVLLHRYTGDHDLVIGSSSATVRDPLVLRLGVDPADPYWAIVRRVQQVEQQAESDAIPFETLINALTKGKGEPLEAPIFRVRFFDETDEPKENFIRSTSLTSDLTVFVTRSATSARASLAPQISLRVLYNSLLFTETRISLIVEQLSFFLKKVSHNPLLPIGAVPLLTPTQRSALPDPTADLNWCGWKGAITDVFSANARSHPDRACVVQSLPGSTEKSVFSYGAIRRASNVLAHHLLRSGIQREEVVMIYAHRSVELLVAVMAILKAGATFSVIDPAYPPSRQSVYLQVAQPRGLIVLRDAGKINPTIREFISNELMIRVEVPGLQVHIDGTIIGDDSETDGRALKTHDHLGDIDPNVVLGPDSIGTLSFTSGSTGIPKGVRGRHFSLTHFFPWMGERFGLDEKSKFTMLSGIAHDPIQRDMFTPLFFGAQLHVPTSEDIGSPGRLAQWMKESRVTVTHLTPAMGQLLSAQATVSIPSLSNAFFVGDVLTKRDCLRLQALAPNCRIINMYGTTETQRAVSYFAIPAVSVDPTFLATQKDIMPAGEGMIDVQLLVVNRNDRYTLCAVGEVGEIYVRSGGLAEGYLNKDATAEKFVNNWFSEDSSARPDTLRNPCHGPPGPESRYWRGIRDRFYRTGDLGRYLPGGVVECTGRADDQIKIRGFRIELGEIDTHLSQHPLVRENVTLVRRDKDEEKILVSYFVPLEQPELVAFESDVQDTEERPQFVQGMRKYRKLIKDIREHLKKKLPSYSVPSLFVPLGRMPLNPNGKIDKPALPFPDTAQLVTSAASDPSNLEASPTEQTMRAIWSSILPSSPMPIPLVESFFDLGGHSIQATRLIFEIRKTFVVDVPLGLVFEHPTIRELAAAVDSIRTSDLGFNTVATTEASPSKHNKAYAEDYQSLLSRLKLVYDAPRLVPDQKICIFLTGATGFLGAFVLKDLLDRKDAVLKVICLVRATDADQGLSRLREACRDRAVWDEHWVSEHRLDVVIGDLKEEFFGMENDTWDRVASEADVIVHNGALVHWVYPYDQLRQPNVLSTITAIDLAATRKPKSLVFVSSTSAIDTEHYVQLSDSLTSGSSAFKGIPETDDLEGARVGLKTGYGQTKWVSEKILSEAGRRGLAGHIVRPGYVVGDSRTAVTNTDDFIWRMVKGCIQLGLVPNINNTVNMVPVDQVALCTSLAAVQPLTNAHQSVLHITARPPLTFNTLLSSLALYGYSIEQVEYLSWRRKLEQHVMETQDNALFPLLHFVLDDLPTSTKAPDLDDANTTKILLSAGAQTLLGVGQETLGIYLAWLVAAGFLPTPPPQTTISGTIPLPQITEKVARAAGRSGR
jgi:L-aminoadipate-semialdehyde dehydrogenase